MIIVIGNEKGGTTKSTTAQNLAYHLLDEGSKANLTVSLMDTDTTSTSYQWSTRREKEGHQPEIPVVRALRDITKAVILAADKADVVVVDVGARSYEHFAELACVVDLWIAPSQVGQGDLDSALAMHELLSRSNKYHKSGKVPHCFVLTRVPTNLASSETQEAREYLLQEEKDLPLLKSMLGERKAYRSAQRLGASIFELAAREAGKAQAEFAAFVKEAMKHKSRVGA